MTFIADGCIYIELSDLKPETFDGLALLWKHEKDLTLEGCELYGTVEYCLIPALKEAEDSPDYFPHGKWATIQRLRGMLKEAKEEAVRKGVWD